MEKRRLLITGFDPFEGASTNPSWDAVSLLPDTVNDFSLCKLLIPTVFGTAAQAVLKKAQEFQPHVILCIGLAGGRSAVTPERIGINIRDARIPDNLGNQPIDQPIVTDGPTAYFTTVPIKAMAEAIQACGLPAAISNTAGTYVCNDVLYSLLHHYTGTPTKIGFIHVPSIPELGCPSLPLADIAAALKAAISVC